MGLFTPEEIKALYEPFPLDYHSIREGNKVDKEGKKIQWFTYLDRPAIQRRLDELFPGEWSLDHIETRRYDKFLAVTLGLSIRGVQRVFNGGQAPRAFGGAIDQDTEKGAYTEAFRRVASVWGLGLYLYEGVRIVTENYKTKNGESWATDWKKKEAVEKEAWQQFASWYSRKFGAQSNNKPSNSTQPIELVQTPPKATEAPKTPENAPVGSYKGNLGAVFSAVLPLYDGKSPHMRNSIGKLESDGVLKPEMTAQQAIEIITVHKTGLRQDDIPNSDPPNVDNMRKATPSRELSEAEVTF